MAQRPLFIPMSEGPTLVRQVMLDFTWHPGLSLTQQRRCIAALHAAGQVVPGVDRILDVSSRSAEALGVALSAFNLTLPALGTARSVSVECAFQGSKVFERGGPYVDLFAVSSRAAKGDPRLTQSGRLIGFRFLNQDWPLDPPTAFYDWLYLRTLHRHHTATADLDTFNAFTDIAFNPARSINCQAHAIALHIALKRRGLLDQALGDRDAFLSLMQNRLHATARPEGQQGSLF